MHLARQTYVILGLAWILTAVILGTPRKASAAQPAPGTQTVKVVNTAAEAVPTAAQGTTTVAGTVAVSNYPATQAVSGSVSVSGTPNVFVSNSSLDPIPVTVAEGGARTPIDRYHTLVFPEGQVGGGDTVYSVPAGKRLVIETFFVLATIGGGENFLHASLERLDGPTAFFPVFLEQQGTDASGNKWYTGSIKGPFYYDSGQKVQGEYMKTGAGSTTAMHWSFTGYLEDMP